MDGPSVDGQIDPEEEAAVQGKLVDLRKQIVAEKEAVRVMQRHIAACDAVMEPHAGLDECLRRLASATQEKETLSGDMFVLSQSGTRLQVSGSWAEFFCFGRQLVDHSSCLLPAEPPCRT